jgi:hypothetical protein
MQGLIKPENIKFGNVPNSLLESRLHKQTILPNKLTVVTENFNSFTKLCCVGVAIRAGSR